MKVTQESRIIRKMAEQLHKEKDMALHWAVFEAQKAYNLYRDAEVEVMFDQMEDEYK